MVVDFISMSSNEPRIATGCGTFEVLESGAGRQLGPLIDDRYIRKPFVLGPYRRLGTCLRQAAGLRND
jgi:hypothetical protein